MMGQRGDDCGRTAGESKMETSAEDQHVNSGGFGEGQERKRAGQNRRGEGHPLPPQQEPRLVTGAYSYLLILCVVSYFSPEFS